MSDKLMEEIVLHDLKNPLSGITGTLDLFFDRLLGPLTEEQEKYLVLIKQGVREIQGILYDMQTVKQIENGHFNPEKSIFSVEELLKSMEWIKVYAAKQGKKVIVSADPKLSIFADRKMLEKVLENLIMNAIKQHKEGARISLTIKKGSGRIEFEITDPVHEIPKEYLNLVFDLSFKNDHPEFKPRIAPGIGFYFCKMAIEAQGGQIKVQDGQNRSKCIFYLPVKG